MPGFLDYLLLAVVHPLELRSLVQYKIWFEKERQLEIDPTSGWERESMRECWEFLPKTSRSFAAVIKQLDGELARVICLFYLVLRGLDTVEDDMTIPDAVKQPILRSFHTYLSQPGWTFTKCGPHEKDRELLVQFHVVITELNHIDPACKEVIVDICRRMGAGMADFAHHAATSPSSSKYVQTIEEYDLYCHYVAGLVGEGLSRLFSASKKEEPFISEQLLLSNSMGLLLQKTNILRDISEDIDDGRYFWPKEIWGKQGFTDLAELKLPQNQEKALWAMSGMTLDAMRHATDALDYLSLLRNQSVFNFCAIPAVMALATLDVCFMNPAVLHSNVKIRKGQAVQLIMAATNPRDVAYLCRDYTRSIHQKIHPNDPYFLKLSIMCGRIEQWTEHHYPSMITVTKSSAMGGGTRAQIKNDPNDARMRVLQREMRIQKLSKGIKLDTMIDEDGTTGANKNEPLPKELFFVVAGGMLLTMLVGLGVVYGVIFIVDRYEIDWL